MKKFKIDKELLEELKITKPCSHPYGHVYRLSDGELMVWGSPDDLIEGVHEYVGTYTE